MACEIMRPSLAKGWETGGRPRERRSSSISRSRIRGGEEKRAGRILPPPLTHLSLSLSLFTRQNTVNRVAETRAKDIIVGLYDILGRCVDFMRANANVLALIALMRVDSAHVHARTLTSPVSSPLPPLRPFPLFHSAGGGLACS